MTVPAEPADLDALGAYLVAHFPESEIFDEAIDDARREYVRQWWERHRPQPEGEVLGTGWAVRVFAGAEPGDAPHLVMTSWGTEDPEDDAELPEDDRSRVPTPIDFPVYGLDDAWPAARWVDGVARTWDEPGNESPTVWLAHGSRWFPAPSEPWVLVGTVSAEREARLGNRGVDLVQRLADTAFSLLIHRTMPPDDDSRLLTAALEQSWERSTGHAQWPAVTWMLDGHPTPARVTFFAGGWAGFCTDAPEAYVMVAAHGVPPERLGLAAVGDGHAYAVDLQNDLAHTAAWAQESATAAFGELDGPGATWPLHPDFRRLLDG